jgi:glc operon protein GlcG
MQLGSRGNVRHSSRPTLLALVATLLCSSTASAQMPNPYGPPITIEAAKRATAAAVAKARENNWLVAVAIVDLSGNLVHFEKMDGTQNGSSVVAVEKARTSALFKRPTKAFQDALAAGGEGLRILALPGVTPVEGGVPLIMDGRIVGAIGVSGVTSAQDAMCAQAGAGVLK